ncbi:restriction endonuclease subunit S [Bacteroides fragilis]|uniref:restriction endonuclease subunit S n=1 Tax=Bacteroides fragilis TaxID=817 RepID=UPI0022AB3E23|nr:restriction endonuclease subunit S [Bacteroides fragilis]MCZ2540896.1 restriction endonuclease subunit S [Bacteroides fragilis]
MTFEVPSLWGWPTLEEITSTIGDGLHGTPQYNSEGDYFFINGNNLSNREIVIKNETKRVSASEYEKYKKPLNSSSILVSINGTIGNIGIYNDEKIMLGKSACYINMISPINIQYMCVILESQYFLKYAIDSATGSTIKNVPLKAINNFKLPLPPLSEQQRIVAEIERWFTLIDQVEQDKTKLQTVIAQTKSKILDLAIHGKLVPQDPNDEPAIELLKRINPNFTPCDNEHDRKLPQIWTWVKGKNIFLPMKSVKPCNEDFLYIDIDSIDNKHQVINKIKTIKTFDAPSRASRYTQKDDVVFSMVRPYLRNIAKVVNNNCIASTGFYICSPIPKILHPNYCYYLMISDYVVNGLNQFMKGDNSPSINKIHIDEWLFPLPPFAEQHRIVQKIEELFSALDNIQKSLEV